MNLGFAPWNLNLFAADKTTRGNVPARSARGVRDALRSVEDHDPGVHYVTVRGPKGYEQKYVRTEGAFVEVA